LVVAVDATTSATALAEPAMFRLTTNDRIEVMTILRPWYL
jgi:hypothetical protein